MSAKSNGTKPSKQPVTGSESQGERWAKYGSNVALMIIVAIVLAILITYIAQAHPWKWDTTRGGVNSLRPQTINVLHDLNSDIKLVSLYSKAEQAAEQTPGAPRPIDRPAMVADLLDSYQSASKHITAEVIDPADKAKLDALQADLDNRYGKGIKDYKAFLSQYDDAAKQLMSQVTGQVDRVNSIVVADKNDEVAPQIQGTLKEMQSSLENSRTDLRRRMAETRPDYRGISNALKSVLSKISGDVKGMLAFFDKNKANPQISQAVRDYITADRPKLEQIQKLADDQVAKIDKLPELKVDELQSALDIPNPILVLGPTQWRVISESQVWPETNSARTAGVDGKLQPTFAGEQQITAAIIGLTSPKKPKVAILRPGGAPLASPGFPPFQAGGPFSDIADRLRLYNFDVVEKDMSGQWAMQAQMQQQMAAPEPSWQDIQDAVWLILDTGSPIQGTEPIAPQLLAHLGHGGSAVILCQPGTGGPTEAAGSDPFQSVVRDWGIDLHSDLMAVHEQPPAPPATSTDPLQDFLRRPFVWDIRDYGDAELAKPIKNLQSLFLVMSPITTHDVSGYTIQKLLPLPDAPAAPKSWGEKDYQELLNNGTPPKFDPSKDMAGPLFGGATSEKKGGGRLVVIGDIEFAINQLLEIPDDAIAHSEGRYVARFPGNGELAMNSVFWAAKMDQMIALSPSALQVSRIGNMAPAALNFWRIGLVLILLPGVVLVSGLGMYFSRKD